MSGPFPGGPSWGPEGAIIKEVWILRRSSYSRIRIFGDLMIRIFGIVFGDLDIRRRVLHADPVGRRIMFWCSLLRSIRKNSKVYISEQNMTYKHVF